MIVQFDTLIQAMYVCGPNQQGDVEVELEGFAPELSAFLDPSAGNVNFVFAYMSSFCLLSGRLKEYKELTNKGMSWSRVVIAGRLITVSGFDETDIGS